MPDSPAPWVNMAHESTTSLSGPGLPSRLLQAHHIQPKPAILDKQPGLAIYSRGVQICLQAAAMKLNIFGVLRLPGPGFKLKRAHELNSSSNDFGLHSRDQRVARMSSKLADSSPSTLRTASRALYFE